MKNVKEYNSFLNEGQVESVAYDGYEDWYAIINGKRQDIEGSDGLQDILYNYLKKAK